MAGTFEITWGPRSARRTTHHLLVSLLLATCLDLAACHYADHESPHDHMSARIENETHAPQFADGEALHPSAPDATSMREVSAARQPIVPVVNTGRFIESPLSDDQIREILAEAEPITPQGTRVWFLRARRNQSYNGMLDYLVTVYFTPNRRSERIRYGACCTIDSTITRYVNSWLRASEKDELVPVIDRNLWTYCQVSSADAPFDESLDIPEGSLLPFTPPDKMTDAELIELVDFVRSGPNLEVPPNVFGGIDKVDGNAPIRLIMKTDEGYEVHTGTLEGPLSGMGQCITCIRTDHGLKLKTLGRWAS